MCASYNYSGRVHGPRVSIFERLKSLKGQVRAFYGVMSFGVPCYLSVKIGAAQKPVLGVPHHILEQLGIPTYAGKVESLRAFKRLLGESC
jgi:hypothetical protein